MDGEGKEGRPMPSLSYLDFSAFLKDAAAIWGSQCMIGVEVQ